MPSILEEVQPSWVEDGWGIQGEQDEYRFDDDLPWDITAWTRDHPDQSDFNCCATSGVCCCYCEDASGIPGYVATISCSPATSAAECTASCLTDPPAPCYTDFHPGEVCDYRCPFIPGFPFFVDGTPCPCNGACYLDDSFGTCYPYANQFFCEFGIGGRYDPNSTCEGSYPGYPCGSDTPGVCCYFNYPAIGLCTSTNETCAECGNMFPGESHQWGGTDLACCCPCSDDTCSDNTGLPCPP